MDIETLSSRRVRFMLALGTASFFLSKPSSPALFAAGFLLALAGAMIRAWAAGQLSKGELVTEGPYALVRHPLYLGSFLMSVGACVIVLSPAYPLRSAAISVTLLASYLGIYAAKARREEAELALACPAFASYRQSVPAWIPEPRRLALALSSTRFVPERLLANREHITLAGFAFVSVLLRFKQVYRW